MASSCATSGYPVVGMQNGEEVANLLRQIALAISVAVFFPWLDSTRRNHMRIFFLHWASGVMYVVSQVCMSILVLNCWTSKERAGPVIYMLKFWELTVLNLWSISSLAIALLIASIVQSFSDFRRVPTVIGSKRTAWCCVATAVFLTLLSAPFWNGVLITGAYFWVTNSENTSHARWISFSYLTTQAACGVLMLLSLIFVTTGRRRASLKVCCKTSNRVKIYFILTIFGTIVYIYNGIVWFFDEFSAFRVSNRLLVVVGWSSKYVHVVADTFILFHAFKALEARDRPTEVNTNSGSGSAGSGLASTATTSSIATGNGAGKSFTPLARPSRTNSRNSSAGNSNSNNSNYNNNKRHFRISANNLATTTTINTTPSSRSHNAASPASFNALVASSSSSSSSAGRGGVSSSCCPSAVNVSSSGGSSRGSRKSRRAGRAKSKERQQQEQEQQHHYGTPKSQHPARSGPQQTPRGSALQQQQKTLQHGTHPDNKTGYQTTPRGILQQKQQQQQQQQTTPRRGLQPLQMTATPRARQHTTPRGQQTPRGGIPYSSTVRHGGGRSFFSSAV